jgi:catechol 2,3-dioxygenase-like lactoylglutathione lyase family enzyme
VRALRSATFDHVGIADESADARLADLLGAPERLTTMPSGVAVGRFGPGAQLELVVPAAAPTPIDRFLERRGPGLHHLGLRVDEPLATIVEELAAAGIQPVGGIEPAADGRPSVFLHPSTTGGVLIELVEGPPRR